MNAPAPWAPQDGSQKLFLQCPYWEVLYEGTRGNGKTDALLMDFAQHVGQGWGADWVGVLFREEFKQLRDVIEKSRKWFKLRFGDDRCEYNESKSCWTWATGEKLYFSYMRREDDYWKYHGHAYPWIGWEELTNWADDGCYRRMFSCSRSTRPGMPRKVRATCNPYGVGHNWVKARFQLPAMRGRRIIDRTTDGSIARVAINGDIRENKILLRADPLYMAKLRQAARNDSELKAWLDGSWDIVAGGMFDDIWQPAVHVLPRFEPRAIPAGWRIDRAFDWGSSRPFSVGWYAESNGEPIELATPGGHNHLIGTVRGDLIRFGEWYGWNGRPNEGCRLLMTDIAEGILDREQDMDIRGRVKTGIADSAIFDEENGNCIAKDSGSKGVRWDRADKRPGSRKQGWQNLRKMLKQAVAEAAQPRELPGLFVTENCRHFIRTFPVLPRSDKDLDDVDSDAEDHIGDEVRYRARAERLRVTQGTF